MVPFNRPYLTGREFEYIQEAVRAGQLAGNGRFTHRCQRWLQSYFDAPRVLLTHSCTAALEMAALLLDLEPGDEVIMPSFTFVSTANAFALRGAVPVFVDIRADTLNIDERLVEAAITSRSKALVVVHYAGVSCEMEALAGIAHRHNLVVIEDAAQGLLSRYRGRPLGSFGDLAAISFHETKNVHCGEGGALVINNARYADRAEILWEKGTDRSKFSRGETDRYTWMDLGSSFLPGELTAAFLWAQLDAAEHITQERLALWQRHYRAYEGLVEHGVELPVVPPDCLHNAHLFRLLLPRQINRNDLIADLNHRGINVVFHYVPLHSSPAGRRLGRAASVMTVTDAASARLIRLPLWIGMGAETPQHIATELSAAISARV